MGDWRGRGSFVGLGRRFVLAYSWHRNGCRDREAGGTFVVTPPERTERAGEVEKGCGAGRHPETDRGTGRKRKKPNKEEKGRSKRKRQKNAKNKKKKNSDTRIRFVKHHATHTLASALCSTMRHTKRKTDQSNTRIRFV
mmetsp:Transcript_45826/g.90263  ORF Transcript_45826/g.90263 Transcript_45826/m.90263 type:complete len:139 (+) Transcript_45826:922-1338(+)